MMGLIKSADVPCGAIHFSLNDFEEQAKQMVASASREAEEILAVANAQAERAKADGAREGLESGWRDGYAAGVQAGTQLGRRESLEAHGKELRMALTALTSVAAEVDRAKAEVESHMVADATELAIAVARRVTKRRGLVDPEVLAANLSEALKLVVSWSDVRIAINPAQRRTLEEVLPRLSMDWPALGRVVILEDSSLAPGGCRVLSRDGQVDADLDAQLNRIAAELIPLREDIA